MKRLTAVLGMLLASSLLASPHGHHAKAHKGTSKGTPSHSSGGGSHVGKSNTHMTDHAPSSGKSDFGSSKGTDFSSPKEKSSPSTPKGSSKQPHF
jgi:hypothetical protein